MTNKILFSRCLIRFYILIGFNGFTILVSSKNVVHLNKYYIWIEKETDLYTPLIDSLKADYICIV